MYLNWLTYDKLGKWKYYHPNRYIIHQTVILVSGLIGVGSKIMIFLSILNIFGPYFDKLKINIVTPSILG